MMVFMYRTLLRAALILLPLLGLTWLFGLLTLNENATVFAWLFTIFNSLQVKTTTSTKATSVGHITVMFMLTVNTTDILGSSNFLFPCNTKQQGIIYNV